MEGDTMTTSISRREFLGGAVASATLVGAGGCAVMPGFGSLRKDESLMAILSDCHVGNWNSPEYQGVKFAECIARVLALDPLPSKMFIPGDLAYLWGRKEDYELSRRLLQPVIDAGIEITIGMGNHDRRENFLERWPEYADRREGGGRCGFSVLRRGFFCPLDAIANYNPIDARKRIRLKRALQSDGSRRVNRMRRRLSIRCAFAFQSIETFFGFLT